MFDIELIFQKSVIIFVGTNAELRTKLKVNHYD